MPMTLTGRDEEEEEEEEEEGDREGDTEKQREGGVEHVKIS